MFYNNNTKVFKEALKLMFEVKIDSVSYPAHWYSYTHPITREEGYAAFVRIDSISSSAHDLYLNLLYDSKNYETLTYTNWLRIPFWKD